VHHASSSAVGQQLRLALFAGLAELAGTRSLDIPWAGGSVGDLRRAIATARPAVAGLLDRSAVAIGGRYADDDVPVQAGADVAILPPVSGG
jgi:molybdopterin synthase sulfur carrier subunit